jgi:hypothetical protein
MPHGNGLLIYRPFAYKHSVFHAVNPGLGLGKFPFSSDEESFLFDHGHPAALRALIQNGQCDMDAPREGLSALKYVLLKKRRVRLARVLVQFGADVDEKVMCLVGYAVPLLMHAAWGRNITAMDFLLKHGAGNDEDDYDDDSDDDFGYDNHGTRYFNFRVRMECVRDAIVELSNLPYYLSKSSR